MSQSQSDIYDTDVGYVEDEPQVYKGPAIPVYMDPKFTTTEREAPDFGSTGTFILQLAGAAQPVQVLQRRTRRNKARVLVMSMGGLGAVNSSSSFGAATNPIAGQVITSIALPAGVYNVQTFLGYQGTQTTADNDNWQLLIGATNLGQLMADTTLSSATQNPAALRQVIVPAGGATLAITALANASGASVIYRASLIATPVAGSGSASVAIFHNRPDVLSNPSPPPNVGISVVAAPFSFDWESQQPLYGVGIGGLVTVSVIDETYAEA